jgi:hypothetical protein
VRPGLARGKGDGVRLEAFRIYLWEESLWVL